MDPIRDTLTLDTATPPPRHRSLPRVLDDYQLVGQLAHGGTGRVYHATHVVTHQRVAIKLLDPQWAEHEDIARRMLDEQMFSSSAAHDGLLRIHEARRAIDGTPYLVMELLDGESLGDVLDRAHDRDHLPLATIASIGAQVADAVAALHDAGVIHCDIKPDNVFVLRPFEHGWRIKVIDYGVAQSAAAPKSEVIAGTPSCMAPEQWRGTPGPKSDVYSLGCVLYWLLTGEPPFTGSLPQLMTAHAHALPVRPSIRCDVPAEIDALVMRALAKDPGMRPTMREIARELAAFAAFAAASEPQRFEAAS